VRSRFRSKLLAVALGGAILVPGLSIPAGAHNFEETTRLSIRRRPTGTVNRGTRVVFSGRLNSDRASCERRKLVELMRVGTGTVGRDITDRQGDYRIGTRVRRDGRYFTRFSGTASGPHPHRHVCFGDRSDFRRVRVR
jgi:hypothetical protein